MANTEYRIIVDINEGGGANSGNTSANNKAQKESSNFKKATSFIIAKQIGKNIVNFASSRVETYTGNPQAQANVNMAMKMVGYGIGFATHPVLTAIALGTDILTQWADTSYQHKWETIGLNDRNSLLGGLSYGRNRGE